MSFGLIIYVYPKLRLLFDLSEVPERSTSTQHFDDLLHVTGYHGSTIPT